MSNTKDVSEIWWDLKSASERFELMKQFGIKKYSRKGIRKVYDKTFNNIINNMEKTFEELIADKVTQQQTRDGQYTIYPDDALELMHQVCEAIIAEIVNKANEYGEIAIADYVSDMPTDRIRIEP